MTIEQLVLRVPAHDNAARHFAGAAALTLCLCCALSRHALGAPHEIEVFTDEITDFKEHSVEVHGNLSRSGAGAMSPRRTSSQVMPEYSYGIARNWEISVQVPTSHTQGTF